MRRQYGIETVVTDEGIVLPDLGSVRSLAMHEGSVVWGVWTGNPDDASVKVGNVREAAARPNAQFKHLVISTTPWWHWLSCFRFTALLKDRPGAILSLLRVLKEHEIRIHSTEVTFSGFNQTRFDAICSHGEGEVQAMIDEVLGRTSGGSAFAVRQRNQTRVAAMRTVGYELLGGMARLEAGVLLAHAEMESREKGSGFLSRAMLERGSLPWFENSFRWTNLDDFLRLSKDNFAEDYFGSKDDALVDRMLELQRYLASTMLSTAWSERLGFKCSTISGESEYFEQLQQTHPTATRLWIRDYLRRLHMHHWTHPVSATGLTRLAYCGVFRDFGNKPLEMRVVRRRDGRWMLKPLDCEEGFLRLLVRVNPPRPGTEEPEFGEGTVALMSITSSDGYARLRFIRSEAVDIRSARFRVRYCVPVGSARIHDPSDGLLASVLVGVQEARGNVERITSTTVRQTKELLEGRIEIAVIDDWGREQNDETGWRATILEGVNRALERFIRTVSGEAGCEDSQYYAEIEDGVVTIGVWLERDAAGRESDA